MIKTYYNLTKPGMVRGNIIVAVAAFMFGSWGAFDLPAFLYMTFGLTCVISSACVFNNYADRGIDAAMERTKKRALVTGEIPPKNALLFGSLLLVIGVLLLWQCNIYTLAASLIGFVAYVFVYTPMKQRTPYALFAGAVAGAMPPVVGYVAAAHMLDYFVVALFMVLFLWQIPHFLAIARFRYDEYAAANVPMFVGKPKNEDEKKRAKNIFFFSLIFLLATCIILVLLWWAR